MGKLDNIGSHIFKKDTSKIESVGKLSHFKICERKTEADLCEKIFNPLDQLYVCP